MCYQLKLQLKVAYYLIQFFFTSPVKRWVQQIMIHHYSCHILQSFLVYDYYIYSSMLNAFEWQWKQLGFYTDGPQHNRFLLELGLKKIKQSVWDGCFPKGREAFNFLQSLAVEQPLCCQYSALLLQSWPSFFGGVMEMLHITMLTIILSSRIIKILNKWHRCLFICMCRLTHLKLVDPQVTWTTFTLCLSCCVIFREAKLL